MDQLLKVKCDCGSELIINAEEGWKINFGNFLQFVCKCGKESTLEVSVGCGVEKKGSI